LDGLHLHHFTGAFVSRVIDRSHTRVPEHAHDWPVVSIYVIGSYLNETEIGEQFIAAPSVVLYRSGAAHRNTVATDGFEQIEIEFDPAWLGRSFLPATPVKRWLGGDSSTGRRALLDACGPNGSEVRLRAALRRFLGSVHPEPAAKPPDWVGTVVHRLRTDTTLRVQDLARGVDRHPSWIGSAYRRSTGEGLQETAARFRVERAANLLRETELPCARVASEAGFCDQSHMNRTVRRLLGRSPTEVRKDRLIFRQI
jgi:AraC-like DNA-binding protein